MDNSSTGDSICHLVDQGRRVSIVNISSFFYPFGVGSEPEPSSGRLTDHVALGVLSSLIRRDLVDEVIAECGKREKRSRLLPAHVVVYYVLALNLFFGEAYEEVMRQLGYDFWGTGGMTRRCPPRALCPKPVHGWVKRR